MYEGKNDMNKLLTTVLMFSAMAAIVPAQAMETDSQKQATTNQAQSQYKKGHQSFLLRHKKKALATVVALGAAAATATYLYGTTAGLTNMVQRLCDSSYKFIMPVPPVPSVSPELNYWETIANWGMPAKMIAIPAPQPSYWQSMYSYLPS